MSKEANYFHVLPYSYRVPKDPNAVYSAAFLLLCDVARRHGVHETRGFSCPHLRYLAELLRWEEDG